MRFENNDDARCSATLTASCRGIRQLMLDNLSHY